MTDQTSTRPPSTRSVHAPSRSELRASVLLPIAISLIIFVVGVIVYLFTPDEFNSVTAVVIGVGLLAFLIYWTRNEPARLRLISVVIAVPALAGITLGMINGRARDTVIGVAITMVLLVLYRLFDTPISYRFAYGRFRKGDMVGALDLVDKAINARPDFWESYQLRSLIHLMEMDFPRAERDAKKAIERKPNAHPVYNSLGQIYLAQKEFEKAADMYAAALNLEPGNGLYRYHYGLSLYRLGQWHDCVEVMLDAIKGLRFVEYELQAHYYLWRSLQELGEKEQAATVHEKFTKYEEGLDPLREQINAQQGYPHAEQLRADLAEIEKLYA